MVPVNLFSPFIVYCEPSASQLSSISHRPCLSQKDFTAARSNGLPSVCASITALVLSESAFSSMVTSILYCGMVTSTNTGTAPYCITGVTVVGNPAATVMTSSPRFTALSPSSGEVSAMNAVRFALEPELTSAQYFAPRYSPSFFSNWSVYLPEVSQNSRELSTRLHISSESYTLEAYGILSPSVNSFLLL